MTQNISFDLQRLIFSFLGGPEDARIPKEYLLACTSVCKRWKEASEDKLWERIRKQKLYTFTPVAGCGSLKEQCLERLKGITERLVERQHEKRAFRVKNPPGCNERSDWDPAIRWRDKMLIRFKKGMALYPIRREGVDALTHEAFFPLPENAFSDQFFVKEDKLIGIFNYWRGGEVFIWDLPSKQLRNKFLQGINHLDAAVDRWLDGSGEELVRVKRDKLILVDLLGKMREKQFDRDISAVLVAPGNRLFVALFDYSSPSVLEQLNLQTLQREKLLNVTGFDSKTKIEDLFIFKDRLFAVSEKSAFLEIDLTSETVTPTCWKIPHSKEIDDAGGVQPYNDRRAQVSAWSCFGPHAFEWADKVFRVYNLETRAHVASYPRPGLHTLASHFAHGEWSEVGSGVRASGSTLCNFHGFNPPLPVPPAPSELSCWSFVDELHGCVSVVLQLALFSLCLSKNHSFH